MHAHSAHLTTPSQPGRRLQWRSLALKSIAFGMVLAATAPVQAKTFHCGAGDVPCLIAAITEANTNGQKKNRIQLDAGTYTLMAADNDTDGPNGFPSITSDLDITGRGTKPQVPSSNGRLVPALFVSYMWQQPASSPSSG